MNKTSNKQKKILLDSSAVIALLRREPGYEMVEEVIASSSISTVNFSEIVSVLIRSKIDTNDVDEIIKDLIPEIIPLSKEIAILAGKLIDLTHSFGLSFGDRACIATSIIYNHKIMTADRNWLECNIKDADIILIR